VNNQAFQPIPGAAGGLLNTIAITIGIASATAALPQTVQSTTGLRFYNSGTAIAFVNVGQTAALASAVVPASGAPAQGIPIGPGLERVINVPPQTGFVGVIGSAANGTLFITQGEGQ
jgi:hypothetical protein